MRVALLALTCCGAAVLATSEASAATCYLVLDRNDNVVYRDIYPPVDLSDAGANERKAMRARNEHMIAMETDRCAPLEFLAGPGTGTRIDLENVSDPVIGSSVKPAADARSGAPAKRSGAPASAAKPAASKSPDKPAKSN